MPKGISTPHGTATRHAVAMLAAYMGAKVRPTRQEEEKALEEAKDSLKAGPDVIPARILQRVKYMDVDDIRNMSIAQSKRERRLARNRKIAGYQEPVSEDESPGAA